MPTPEVGGAKAPLPGAMRRFSLGQLVLITGASHGIGRAITVRLAREGFDIALNFHERRGETERVLATIRDAGGNASLLPFDVADRAATRSAIDSDIREHESYFGIVCNAGIHSDGLIPAMSEGAWARVLRTNRDGFYNVVQPTLMPMIRSHRGGHIVTIPSTSGLVGNRGQVNYRESKAGLIRAPCSLALELAKPRITVNSVAPGLIETEMLASLPVEELARGVPMRRLGTPEKVAGPVAFLFSADVAYITGQVISVNGGRA